MTEDERTTALGLFHFAHSYAASAACLRRSPVRASHADAPIRFLYSHAIELYLKSFLRMHGLTVAELKSRELGHKTSVLAEKAMSLGLVINSTHRAQIDFVDSAILDRYILVGARATIDDDAFHSLCSYLNESIGSQIYARQGTRRPVPSL
jgi:hypothetical protein